MSASFTLLNGQLKMYDHQPRPSEDSIWMAACVQAKNTDTILDVGCGTGVLALCLKTRFPHTHITAIDIQAGLVEKTQQNAALNKFKNVIAHTANLVTYVPSELFDHVVTNPPFYAAQNGHNLPDATRNIAHTMQEGDLELWMKQCASFVKPEGTLTILHHAEHTAEIVALFKNHTLTTYQLKTCKNKAAKRVIIQICFNHKETHVMQTITAYDDTLRTTVLSGKSI